MTAAVSWRAMFVIDAALAAALIAAALALSRVGVPDGAVRLTRWPATGGCFATAGRCCSACIVLVEGAAFFGGTGYLGALLHDEYGVGLAGVGLILMLDGAAIFVTSRLIGRIAPMLGEAPPDPRRWRSHGRRVPGRARVRYAGRRPFRP